jgi:hypothetical protein
MKTSKPLLAAAFICEKVLQDKDDALSAIRIVDTFTVSIPSDIPLGVQPQIGLTLLVSFKAGDAEGKHELLVKLRSPAGDEIKGHYGQVPLRPDEKASQGYKANFEFKPGQPEDGANLVISCSLPIKQFGLYYFEVFVDDEMVTRVPFRLRESAAPSNA